MPKAPAPALPAPVRSFVDVAAPLLGSLYSRWQDERAFEDFAEYRLPLEKAAANHPGIVLGAMKRRPFGVTFTHGGAKYRLQATAAHVTLYSGG